MATTAVKAAPDNRDLVRVIPKHHILVRVSHWLNVPILLGLTLSGLAIYWASPVFQHAANPTTGNDDYLGDVGIWICRHIVFLHHYATPTDWFYNHASLGTGDLAAALTLHWLFAYLFMANGLMYAVGLGAGGGYKALLPRRTDIKETFLMVRYYIGLLPAKLLRKRWIHPEIKSKYNALQRTAYLSMPIFGLLAVATGWAIHKPQQLGWLQWCFGGYDWTRVWHFWIMWFFVLFLIPHLILVIADGWDTMRSMVVGWSDRVEGHSNG